MRHVFCIAFAAVQLVAASAGRGQGRDSTASLSRELLEIWNRNDEGARSTSTLDRVLRAEGRENGFGAVGARPDARTPGPGAAIPGFASPAGRSLTPSLDRLLGRGGRAPGGATPIYGAPTGLGTRLPAAPGRAPYGSSSGTPLGYCPTGGDDDDHSSENGNHGSGNDGSDHGGGQGNGGGAGNGNDGNNGHKGKGGQSDPPATPTPEPATLVLYGAVCGLLVARALWRRAFAV